MQLSITIILVIITALVSFGGFSNAKMIDDLIFYPPAITNRGQWYRFVTSGFIHADAGHLIFNMIALYSFGGNVERAFGEMLGTSGPYVYLLMYLSALVVSLLPTYFKHKDSYHYRGLGASGAVSAVLFAGLLLAPESGVFIFFLGPIPGFVFAPLYLILSAVLSRRAADNINHSAHIWGAVYGLAFTILVGTIADYQVIQVAVERIKYYMQSKGWTR